MLRSIPWATWNVLLAAVPVALAYALAAAARAPAGWRRSALLPALAALWLAFLPNTCYLLTEWRHFLYRVDRYDLYVRANAGDDAMKIHIAVMAIAYLLYSTLGVIAFVLALRPIAELLRARRVPFALIAPALFLLVSLGVYLGLIVRLNSWDLWLRPLRVLAAIAQVPRHPALIAVIILFSGLLALTYFALDALMTLLVVRRTDRPVSARCQP